jgi:hypothetical protein
MGRRSSRSSGRGPDPRPPRPGIQALGQIDKAGQDVNVGSDRPPRAGPARSAPLTRAGTRSYGVRVPEHGAAAKTRVAEDHVFSPNSSSHSRFDRSVSRYIFENKRSAPSQSHLDRHFDLPQTNGYCWRNHSKATSATCTQHYGCVCQGRSPLFVQFGAMLRTALPAKVLVRRIRQQYPTVFEALFATNGVEPLVRLIDVLDRMVSGRTKVHELEQLLPWRWKAERLADFTLGVQLAHSAPKCR